MVLDRSAIPVIERIAVGHFARLDQVAEPDFSRIEPELFCNEIEHAFNDECGIRPARAAMRTTKHPVGKDRVETHIDIRYFVETEEMGRRHEWRIQPIRNEGAGFVKELVLQREQTTVIVKGDRDVMDIVRAPMP